jgi:hypothetical protein
MSKEEKPSLFRKATNLFKRAGPATLNLGAIPPPPLAQPPREQGLRSPKVHPALVSGIDLSVGDAYLQFTDPKTNHKFLAHPLTFLPGQMGPPHIAPGSHNPLGVPGLWANDLTATARLDWTDDPERGVFSRKIYQLEDVIGCRGSIQEVAYAFEAVLQIGRGVVVYQLTNLETCLYIARGFGRDHFDVRHALINHLRKSGEGRLEYSPSKVIGLSERVLEVFPTDVTALFNKGSALLGGGAFAQSHACFELLLREDPGDQLAILHDAVALAKMGEERMALKQFTASETISQEQFRDYLRRFPVLREAFQELLKKVMNLPLPPEDSLNLWLKYFGADEGASS